MKPLITILATSILLFASCESKKQEKPIEQPIAQEPAVVALPTPSPILTPPKPTPKPVVLELPKVFYLSKYQSIETDSGITGYPVGTKMEQRGYEFYAPNGVLLKDAVISSDVRLIRALMAADRRSQQIALPEYQSEPTVAISPSSTPKPMQNQSGSSGLSNNPFGNSYGHSEDHSAGLDAMRKSGKLIH